MSAPLACVQAGQFPVLRLRLESATTVQRVRLHFRPTDYPLWYAVPVRPSADGGYAVMPKPQLAARRIHYYFEFIRDGTRRRTPEGVALVVETPLDCPGAMASSLDEARVLVEVPPGAPLVPPVPPGFTPVGAVAEGQERRRDGPLVPLAIAGGLGAIVAAGTALGQDPPATDTSPTQRPQLLLLDSSPPARSTMSLSTGPVFSVRLLIRPGRAVGPGRITVTLYRFQQSGRPCALLASPHEGMAADGQEVLVAGPFLDARPCETDRMRISLEEAGQEVMTTGRDGLLDIIVAYSLVP